METLVQKLKRRVGPTIIRRLIGQRKPRPLPASNDRIVVGGLFNTASGIGESARLCFEGLRQTGLNVEALNLSWVFGMSDFEYQNSMSETLENLETGGTLILHLNAPETLTALWKSGFRVWHKKWRVIGYWAWELPIPPSGWEAYAPLLDELWVPSRFVKASLEKTIHNPIKVVPHAIRSTPELPKKESNTLNCLITADGLSSFERKNVLGALDAYILAFPHPEKAKLRIKCRNLNKHHALYKKINQKLSTRGDITLITETLSIDDLAQLCSQSDVLLSLHRAEGFGLTIAETMEAGNIAICTAWSGNMDFVSEETACLVNYDLIPVEDPYGIYEARENAVWADPDINQAANILKDVYLHRMAYAPLRVKARKSIRAKLSAENYLKALRG